MCVSLLLSQLENKHNFKWKWLFDLALSVYTRDVCKFVVQIVELITVYCAGVESRLDVIMSGFVIIKRKGDVSLWKD